ncbi:MAG: FGGY-family carbohydrate kinase, partial [Chthoniobacterales bacterium]
HQDEGAGAVGRLGLAGRSAPVAAILGDQQSALFGQACFSAGEAKATYGTGSFILMNSGRSAPSVSQGLLSTVAWGTGDRLDYALGASVFVAGAAVQWLRDGLGVISRASESEAAAKRVDSTLGTYVVPAFTGLGAPYWDPAARGAIVGLTRGVDADHIVRATLESLAYQTRDVVDAMSADSGKTLRTLRVDGGAAANNFLMQFQADILGVPVDRPTVIESTATGAAFLAGVGAGLWKSSRELESVRKVQRVFRPKMKAAERRALYLGWQKAVARVRGE